MLRRVSDIEYLLMPRSERSTTDIVIERNGTIIVRPSKAIAPEDVDALVYDKRRWIYENLAEWRDLNATSVIREWVNGETFPYLGRNYRLRFVTEQTQPLLLKEGWFCLRRDIIEREGPAGARMEFRRFYTQKGRLRLRERVSLFAPKVGVKPGDVSVKDLGFNWGKCMSSGDMHFHWKTMMAPLDVLDYVVVHELCHMRFKDHTDAFWNEIDKVLPDYRNRKEWLRCRGASLSL